MILQEFAVFLPTYLGAFSLGILIAIPVAIAKILRNPKLPTQDWILVRRTDFLLYFLGAGMFLGFLHSLIVLRDFPAIFSFAAAGATPFYPSILAKPKRIFEFLGSLLGVKTSFNEPKNYYEDQKFKQAVKTKRKKSRVLERFHCLSLLES